MQRLAIACLLLAGAAHPRSLNSKIDKLLKRSPIAQSSFIGVLVEAESGKRLAARNEQRLFTPASNTKLFSAALALETLGPTAVLTTRVEQRGPDLFLIGGGDATLNTADLEAMAAEVAVKIRDIPGNIVGDDTLFLYDPLADSWEREDIAGDDGPPSTALVIDENVVQGHSLADPALVAASQFKIFLERLGVTVEGQGIARHRAPGNELPQDQPGVIVAQHRSQPLLEDLRHTLKVSQNLHADLLLFDVGCSRQEGLAALSRFLESLHIEPEEFRFEDGSGLSRKNLVTPHALVMLLRIMLASPHREQWLDILSVPKTGTLEHVSALSGYSGEGKRRRIFSILINNTTAPTAEARALIAKIVKLIEE